MSALLSMAQQFSGLPIKSLIGAPLKAAAEANSLMAHTQTEFMLQTCFTGDPKDAANPLTPIMLTFKVTRPVVKEDGTKAEPNTVDMTFTLPLLTIIPLNSLAVDDVKVHFEMEVKSSTSTDNETASSSKTAAQGSMKASVGYGPFSCEVSGSVSSSSESSSSSKSHYEASNSAKYEIDVHAGQLPLPTGVTTIIEAFTKNIAPIQLKAGEKVT